MWIRHGCEHKKWKKLALFFINVINNKKHIEAMIALFVCDVEELGC